MANPRFILYVCLASITLFSFNCAAPTDKGSLLSEVKDEGSHVTAAKSTNPVIVSISTQQAPETTSSEAKLPATDPTVKPTPTTKPTPEPTTPTTKPTTSPTTAPTTVTVPTSTISPTSPTSSTSPTPSSTTTSSPPTTAAPSKHDRSFDLPSFIGGVILALGLAAIGYVVYKFYRTRTDPNYRSL